ncbi:MAG: ABC transporter [Deltaproteobacteria bacterium RBG_19FT_COMBO_43_11]|nr:MAG: ABC transporter [Deltaproteobacteria bacterium RBG_16_44_11]OGP91463.1 MAG: ABC transporter [Deltaproteobacteria bacterium RBG_19FT_COMBO_43_11]
MSSNDVAIRVNNLGKCYQIYNAPRDRLKQFVVPRLQRLAGQIPKQYFREFWALKDVSFEIKKGETIGIIGRNGAGKSTLLQLICGTLNPTGGSILTNGRVAALLELGSGFNPEFTGRENVYMNAAIMGLSIPEVDAKYENIIAFADIGDFINQPVKTYSSGMLVRLAFSVAAQVDPDILIVDEALGVGDMFFQAKCMIKMKKLIDNEGTTLLFVSHDTGTVKSICKRGILLNKGFVIYDGDGSGAVEKYFGMKIESEQNVATNKKVIQSEDKSALDDCFNYSADFEKKAAFQRVQNGKASFKSVVLLDENEKVIESVEYGQKVKLRMAVVVHEDIHLLGYGYHIRDKNGVDVIYSDCFIEGQSCLENLKAGDRYIIDWCFNPRLRNGNYSIASVISIPISMEIGQVDFCDFVPISCQFVMNIRQPFRLHGLVNWDNEIVCRKVTGD